MQSDFFKHIIGGPSDFGIGWVIILISSAITFLVSAINLSKWVVNKSNEKKFLLKKIALLDTGSHITHFISLLGNYVSVDENKEYIFVNNFFYVQAIADQNGSISTFSLTTRKKNFHPVLRDQFGSILITVGSTNFSELTNPIRIVKNGDHGVRNFYSEVCYFGYRGGYRNYAFSSNPNGYGKMLPFSDMEDITENPMELKNFRATTLINTYSVGVPREPSNFEYFGPKYNQIRVF